jgi:hypothetical protein
VAPDAPDLFEPRDAIRVGDGELLADGATASHSTTVTAGAAGTPPN